MLRVSAHGHNRDRYGRKVRIAISGTHASGKTRLIDDYCALRPDTLKLGDPFEFLETASDPPGPSEYLAQLQIAERRLHGLSPDTDWIIERTPLDFLAYLDALEALGRTPTSPGPPSPEAYLSTIRSQVDFLVLLPLEYRDDVVVAADEDPELRIAMNDALFTLVDSFSLANTDRVVEITGPPETRLARLLAEVEGRRGEAPAFAPEVGNVTPVQTAEDRFSEQRLQGS